MSDRGALLVKGIAGFGNRIFNALNGICYARLTGRELFIDWSDPDYSPDHSNIFPSLFQCPLLATGPLPQTDSIYPAIWCGQLGVPARALGGRFKLSSDAITKQLSIDLAKIDYPEELLVLVAYNERLKLMRPHFRGSLAALAKLPGRVILQDMLRRDLILHPHVQEQVAQFKRRHFTGPTVGVHIRYSDYRTALFTLIRRLNELLRSHPDLTIFLASDSADVTQMIRRVYPRVVTTEHWFAQPGESIHKNRSCPDKLQSAIDALTDLYLLAACDYLLFDWTSSFGRVAHLLSDAPSNNTVVVRPHQGKNLSKVQRGMTQLMRKLGFFAWGFRLMPRVIPLRWL